MKILVLLLCLIRFSSANELTVLADSFPPFSYIENGQNKGMAYEIAVAMLEDSKIPVKKHVITTWKSAFKYTNENPYTLVYSIVRTKEREGKYHWVGPLSDRRMYFYTLKSHEHIELKSYGDVAKYTTLSLEASTVTDYIKSRGAVVYTTRDLDQAYKMLLNKRAELLVMLDYSLNYLDKNNKLVKPLMRVGQPGIYYFALNINTPIEIVEKLQASFDKLKREGVIDKIKSKY